VVVNPFRKSSVVFLAWTLSVLSKIFHLLSTNPPTGWLDSKVTFLSTVIINTCYASFTIDNIVFAYFKMPGCCLEGCMHLGYPAAGQIDEGFTRPQRKR
jgi:hypothetical protein